MMCFHQAGTVQDIQLVTIHCSITINSFLTVSECVGFNDSLDKQSVVSETTSRTKNKEAWIYCLFLQCIIFAYCNNCQ